MKNKKRTKPELTEEDIEDVNMNAVTDSEDEYTEQQKMLLQKVRTKKAPENFDSDDEVYGFESSDDDKQKDEKDDSEDEDDSMESDIEGLQEDDNLPNERAWGKKKRDYYSTDYVDPDYTSATQKDMATAEMEEQEARNIQKRLAEQLDDADFGFEFFQDKEDIKDTEDDIQHVKIDFSKLSTREKRELFHKESPEFLPIVTDYKSFLVQCRDILAPFLELVKIGKYPDCPAAKFLKLKYEVALHYCINISFYLMLKAKRIPIRSHPVMKRLAQYRQLLNQFETRQGNLLKQIEEVLRVSKEGQLPSVVVDSPKVQSKKKSKAYLTIPSKSKMQLEDDDKMISSGSESMADEEEIEDNNSDIENTKEEISKVTNMPLETEEQDGKRAITYQMAKNKGLTPYRKKEQRNPRVKHRNKYRKAKIRRKGAVREVRKEVSRYGGEISGIKASVKKSITLK